MDTPPDPMLPVRLKLLRDEAGIISFADASRRYKVGEGTYKHAASGRRGLSKAAASKIARYHGISMDWVLEGLGSRRGAMKIPLLGCVGAGQEMMLFENVSETTEACYDPDTSIAFEIQGDSMLPVARDRDIAFFGPEQRDFKNLLHQECLVVLQDGRRFFKILQNGSKSGVYSLASYNGTTIADVEVHSAGRFLGVRRR